MKMKTLFLVVSSATLACVFQAGAQSTIVTIPASVPWTQTPITVSTGQVVTINANGIWTWDSSPTLADGFDGAVDPFLNNGISGSLVAYVGTTPPTDQFPSFPSNPTKNGLPFPQSTNYWEIGSTAQFFCPVSGTLYLGINEDAQEGPDGDESGSLTVQVFVGIGKTNDFKLPRPALFGAQVFPSNGRPTSAKTFEFSVSGPADSLWAVYASSDLANWTFLDKLQLDDSGNGLFTNVVALPYRFYKLDNGMRASEPIPVAPESLNVSGGNIHSAAADFAGNVWAWGDNSDGELGFPVAFASSDVAVQVPNMPGSAVSVSCGNKYTLATLTDGSVWGWGDNSFSELANPASSPVTSPVQIMASTGGALQNVVSVAASIDGWLNAALTSDGKVYAWGAVGSLQFAGPPYYRIQSTAGMLWNPSGFFPKITQIAVGYGHILMLQADGTVFPLGLDSMGQCGLGGTNLDSNYGYGPFYNMKNQVVNVVVQGNLAPLSDVIAVAAGGSSSYAIRSDGSLWAWGDDTYGQLGYINSGGATQYYATQVVFPYQVRVAAVRPGATHCLVMATDGSLWAMGNNRSGQLGDNQASGQQAVSPILLGYRTEANSSQWAGVAAGENHSIAVVNIPGSPPAVLSWGANASGQLGNNSTTMQKLPVSVLTSPSTAFGL